VISAIARSGRLGAALGLALAVALLLAVWNVARAEPHLLLRRDADRPWLIAELYRSGAKCGAQQRRLVAQEGPGRARCVRVGDRVA
jgi:hypothetical protein